MSQLTGRIIMEINGVSKQHYDFRHINPLRTINAIYSNCGRCAEAVADVQVRDAHLYYIVPFQVVHNGVTERTLRGWS